MSDYFRRTAAYFQLWNASSSSDAYKTRRRLPTKKTAPEELEPSQGLMLGIYLLGVSPAWINPASPGWPAVVSPAWINPAYRAAQIANDQGRRMPARRRPKTEAHEATKTKMEGGILAG